MERLLPQLPKQKLYDDVSSGLQYTAGGAVRAEVVGAAWQQQADVGGGDIVFGEPTFSFGSENFGCVVVYVAGCADSAACCCICCYRQRCLLRLLLLLLLLLSLPVRTVLSFWLTG